MRFFATLRYSYSIEFQLSQSYLMLMARWLLWPKCWLETEFDCRFGLRFIQLIQLNQSNCDIQSALLSRLWRPPIPVIEGENNKPGRRIEKWSCLSSNGPLNVLLIISISAELLLLCTLWGQIFFEVTIEFQNIYDLIIEYF